MRWVRQVGKARPPGDRRRTELPPAAKQLYESGRTLAQVAAKFRVSPDTVQKRLRELGTTIRPAKIKYGHVLTAERLRFLYLLRNWRADEIARECGCNTGTVYNWLRRNGIPLKRQRPSV